MKNKRIFQNMFDSVISARLENDGTIVTRPNQSLTIEETIVRFGQNGTLKQNAGFHYYDDMIGTDTSKLTFEQLHDYSVKVAEHAAKLSMAAQQKAHDDREKEVNDRIDAKVAQMRVERATQAPEEPKA